MPLVNIFIACAFICFGVCCMATLWGWGHMIGRRLEPAARAFATAKDAGMSGIGFAAIGLFGLIFI